MSKNVDQNSWTPVGELPDRQILTASRGRIIFGILFIFVILVLFVFLIRESGQEIVRINGLFNVKQSTIFILGLIAAGIALINSLINLIRPLRLILSPTGFEIVNAFKSKKHQWNRVARFEIVKIKRNFITIGKYLGSYELMETSRPDGETQLVAGPAIRLNSLYGLKIADQIELLNRFRERALQENGEEGGALDPIVKMSTLSKGDTWAPVDERQEGSYMPGEERAPWGKWVAGIVILGTVALGALWLISQVVVPKDLQVNRPQIELPAGETVTETEQPPKSADELAWVKALEKDTLEGYREYLDAFPNGRFKDKAKAEIDKYDNQAWARAESRNTIAGYEDYLADWPEGLHAPKAQERIDALRAEIEAAKKDAAARRAADQRAWQKADSTNTITAYEDYLSGFPSGQYANIANERITRIKSAAASAEAAAIEEQAWVAAKTANTAESYETYLSSYPAGKYVPLAKAALETLKPTPGKTFKDCNVCPTMMTLVNGNAELGASPDEPDVRPNEMPKRPVIFARPFSIAVTEVTFDQWQACVSDGACQAVSGDNGWGRGSRPVINVSWDDAQKYTGWLSNRTGHQYSLPSEAQWEYAARGGDKGVYIGGSVKALCAFANGAGAESGLAWANMECRDLASDRSTPTGALSANKAGLKDMIGNVAEWTLDCNTLNLKDAPTNGDADLRGSCNQRVTRGGSWFSGPADMRYSARLMQRRGDRNDFTGFRVVRN